MVLFDGTNTETYTYNYNAGNRLTSSSDGSVTTAYVYDNNGNLTAKTVGSEDPTTYTYTYENWLASVTLPDDSTTSYTYCALGKRVMKVDGSGTVMYRPDGNNTSVEQDGSGNTLVAYTYNPYGLVDNIISNRKSGTDSYYHYDGIGNVGNLTNGSETVTTSYAYDAFGNILSGSSSYNKVGFQTKPWEGDVGLYYSRARYYDPAVGRFISKDPLGCIDGPNLYVYTGNNPVNKIDPLGLACGPGTGVLDWLIQDEFSEDGETFSFQEACHKHDACYGNHTKRKVTCDKNFYTDMKVECTKLEGKDVRDTCLIAAGTYYNAVKFGGFIPYWYAQWKDRRNHRIDEECLKKYFKGN